MQQRRGDVRRYRVARLQCDRCGPGEDDRFVDERWTHMRGPIGGIGDVDPFHEGTIEACRETMPSTGARDNPFHRRAHAGLLDHRVIDRRPPLWRREQLLVRDARSSPHIDGKVARNGHVDVEFVRVPPARQA